jgi:protein ImuA
MPQQARHDTVRRLAEQLRGIERGQPTGTSSKLASTGLAVLDALLPEGGIRPGSIIEWLLPGPGSGGGTLALLVAAHQMQQEGNLIVIDPQNSFHPPAAANLGIDLERTIVVRPGNTKDTLWSAEQTLRCAGVAAAICHLDHLDDRVFRRLQLAAETGGGLGLFLRLDCFREQPSWADVRLRVRGVGVGARERKGDGQTQSLAHSPPLSLSRPRTPSPAHERLLQLELLRCRNNSGHKAILIGIDHETSSVRLVSELASAASLPRAARA